MHIVQFRTCNSRVLYDFRFASLKKNTSQQLWLSTYEEISKIFNPFIEFIENLLLEYNKQDTLWLVQRGWQL